MAVSINNRPLDLDNIWPVGSIYMNVSNVSPATIFGGTWEALEDRFLVGAGSTYTGTSKGGARTHTLITNELPSHNHTFTGSSTTSGNQSAGHTHTYTDYYATTTGSTAISTAQLASHTHGVPYNNATNAAGDGGDTSSRVIKTTSSYRSYTDSGSAGSSNGHAHTGANTYSTSTSNGISANHTHTLTAVGSIGNTGSGTAFSIEPPYLVVYMWKRTA